MTSNEKWERFQRFLSDFASRPELEAMKKNPQHKGNTSFAHCVAVADMSYKMAEMMGLEVDMESLVHGAMMHDFYLYDTKTMPYSDYEHSLVHPKKALENAEKVLPLNDREKNIILSHMWPIPGTPIPRYPEAWLVCLADKICAWQEMYGSKRQRPEQEDRGQGG